ncbi:MAG: FadR family transcriptional regulator [Deltaproteobacteria bacterium]|nr:FadR family transcriptional regulator [Deltaproteobacteria bacterium]
MLEALKPVRVESTKDACIASLEALILSGKVKAGEKLAPERELALRLGVSRPVVHEALVDLAAKGLVEIIPRVGTVVNDYLKNGSLCLLMSLVNYQKQDLDPKILDGLLNMRKLFETETARLAAANRTMEQLEGFFSVIFEESQTEPGETAKIVALDFDLHLRLALASSNVLYTLLMNSFKPVYTTLSAVFFSDENVVPTVFDFHRKLVSAIADQNEDIAMEVIKDILAHGEDWLKTLLKT